MTVKRWTVTVIAAAWMALAAGGVSAAGDKDTVFFSVGTGSSSGAYYATGRALCDVVNHDIGKDGYRCSAEGTPGSVYNLDGIASGELELAFVQGDVHDAAARSLGRWQATPVPTLRSVMSLYPEMLTIVVRADAGIAGFADLKGKRVNVGTAGSGTRATWDVVADAAGLKLEDLAKASELPPDDAGRLLCDGGLDASVLVIGHPSAMVKRQLAACDLRLIPVEGAFIDKLVADKTYFNAVAVPGAAYGLAADLPTIGSHTTLVTSSAVPEALIEAFVKAVMTNLPALRQRQPLLADLKDKTMTQQSLVAPLHPGAAKAYRDLGLSP